MALNTQPLAPTPALAAIQRAAAAQGIAWKPLAAVAHFESGLNPTALGDGGHAFGLFQNNNAGGTITGDPNPRRFFDPNVSAQYAARAVKALGIQGETPQQQVADIVNRYERPAKPQPEIAGAQSYLATLAGSVAPAVGAGLTRPTGATVAATPQTTSANGGALPSLSLAPLQSGLDLSAQQNQRALDALGKISGRSTLAAAAPDLAQMLATLPQQQATAPAPAAKPQGKTPAKTTVKPGSGGFALPLGGAHFKPLGQPYQGTHSVAMNVPSGSNNWESENAIDLGTPIGTPIYAVANGTIGSQIGPMGTGRFAGNRVHLVTKGNEFYYAHLSKLAVKAGQTVQKGQLIGYSGAADGVAHLHIAAKNGNPETDFDY